jgi:hypothetical protein
LPAFFTTILAAAYVIGYMLYRKFKRTTRKQMEVDYGTIKLSRDSSIHKRSSAAENVSFGC